MSLKYLADGWMQFGNGNRWRMAAPRYLCEVNEAGNIPNYLATRGVTAELERVKTLYAGRLTFGKLDSFGTGLDILAANAFTASRGMVSDALTPDKLREVQRTATGDLGTRLHQVVLHIARTADLLERREPGYRDPIRTAGRVSLGCHHMLISTALIHSGAPADDDGRSAAITDLVCRLPGDPLFAGELVVSYFNLGHHQHKNQPPLLAATYNAGSPRLESANAWNLRQYGDHISRWIAYYNTSRSL